MWVLLRCRNCWLPGKYRNGTECTRQCVGAEACPQSGDRQLKERVKIVTLIKGSWVPLRLHVLPHSSRTHPHSSLPHLPASQRIYCPPLSAGPLKGPPFLNFMPWVNSVFPSNGGCWASPKWPASFFQISFWVGEKWIWNGGIKDINGVEKQAGSEMSWRK